MESINKYLFTYYQFIVCVITRKRKFQNTVFRFKKYFSFSNVLNRNKDILCSCTALHVLSFMALRRYSYPEWLTDIHIVLSSINIAVFHFIQNFALPTVIIHWLYSVNNFKKTNSLQPKCSSSSIKSVSKERLCPHCMCMIVCFVKTCLSLDFTCFL